MYLRYGLLDLYVWFLSRISDIKDVPAVLASEIRESLRQIYLHYICRGSDINRR